MKTFLASDQVKIGCNRLSFNWLTVGKPELRQHDNLCGYIERYVHYAIILHQSLHLSHTRPAFFAFNTFVQHVTALERQ